MLQLQLPLRSFGSVLSSQNVTCRRTGFFRVASCLLCFFSFDIKINDMVKAVLKDSESSLCVEDFDLLGSA